MRVHGEPLPLRAGAQSGQRVAVDTHLPCRSGTHEPAAQARPAGVSGIGWQAGVSHGLCAWCGCGIPREGPRSWSDVPDRPRGRQTPALPPLRACRPLEVSEPGRALPLPLRPLPLLLPLALARPSCPWGSLALGGLGLGARRAPGGTRGLSLPPHRVKMCSGQGQEGGVGPRRAPLGPSWPEDGAAWQDRGGEAAPESWAASRRRWHCAGPGGKCRRWWAQCAAWRAQRRPPNLGRGRVHRGEGEGRAGPRLEVPGGGRR